MRFKKNKLIMAVAGVMTLAACEKNLLDSNRTYVFPDDSKEAGLKIIHAYAGKSPALTTGAGPNLFMYLGTQKLNGNVLNWTAGGGFWPTTSTSTTNIRALYSIVPAGTATLYGVQGRVAAGVPAPAPGDTIFTKNQAWEAGKNYTVFLTDTLPNPGVLAVEDKLAAPREGYYQLRFANMVAWPDDIQEVFSKRENKVIFSNVGYKKVTDFIELKVPTISDTLTVTKVSGSSPMPYSYVILGFTGLQKRAYTVYTKGKNLGTTTSATFQNFMGGVVTVY
jgi:hypothetical protein